MTEDEKRIREPDGMLVDAAGSPTGKSIWTDEIENDPETDARWHKSVHSLIPRVLWDPNHPARKSKKANPNETA